MLITHQMACPVKVEGNPDHPASLGAASATMQATILELCDPRRAQSVLGRGQIDTWQSFVTAMIERRERLLSRGGEGLRLLTGNVTSPSLAAQIGALQQQFPAMRWHQWEPLHRDNQLAAWSAPLAGRSTVSSTSVHAPERPADSETALRRGRLFLALVPVRIEHDRLRDPPRLAVTGTL